MKSEDLVNTENLEKQKESVNEEDFNNFWDSRKEEDFVNGEAFRNTYEFLVYHTITFNTIIDR